MCAPVGLRFQTPQTFILDYSCQVYDSNAAIPFYYFTFVSSDGGSTWAGAQVESADFYSTTGGLALGPRAANGDRYFYTTSDGGRNWVKGNKVTWSNAQLSYLDALKGWAVVWRVNPVTGVTEYALVKTINGDGPWGLITPKVK
jgi:hypothetical protein